MTGHALPYALAATACVVSALGGIATLRLKHGLGAIFGICAGILVGVALFDMLPETLDLLPPHSLPGVLAAALVGALGITALGRGLPALPVGRRLAPHLGPASLTLHSFVEGLGIGLGFRLSPAIGWTVAVGVLAHDLADGVNVVSLGLAAGSNAAARRWLVVNSLAPIVGVFAAQLVTISAVRLAWVMAVLVGVFLVIAGRELLPRSARLIGVGRSVICLLLGFGLVSAWSLTAS